MPTLRLAGATGTRHQQQHLHDLLEGLQIHGSNVNPALYTPRSANSSQADGLVLARTGTGVRYSTLCEEVVMALEDEAKGKAKEFEGKVTGDKSREAEGKVDQAVGKAKDIAEDVRDAAGNLIDRAREEIAEHRPGSSSDPKP
jgi:uncharacterized protein YjbJ (UPF0337 family)